MNPILCSECGTIIQPRTAEKFGGLCAPCSRGDRVNCIDCGVPTLRTARGVDLGSLCRACRVERERLRPTSIDSFVERFGADDCTLLKRLFHLEERLRRASASASIGLDLIDPPEHWDSAVTPRNTIAFAMTGGNGIHFSLVTSRGRVTEASPVVVTYPRNQGTEFDTNYLLGDDLREFLSLACRCGYDILEDLPHTWDEVVEDLAEPDPEMDFEDTALQLATFRRELGLDQWRDVGTRLAELQKRRRFLLRPKRRWLW